ncbi:MAG: hypothetical protein M1114_05130 [Candidatus Dependentiae bacterium]|nr:hypothetical protein [Candidatus Dependentiae bacterium]
MISSKFWTFSCIIAILLAPTPAVAPRLKIKQRLLGKSGHATLHINNEYVTFSDTRLTKVTEPNKYLNNYNATYFNVPFLKNKREIRSFLRKNKKNDNERGIPFRIQEDATEVHGSFFDRNSDHLVVISGGFTNCHEYMAPFIKLFPNYDLLFFDLPGHGLEQGEAQSVKGQIAQALLGLNFDSIELGDAESQTIIIAVNHFKQKKKYTKIAGVARCYSVPFFAQAGIAWEKENKQPLFDKLILDAPFSSFQSFMPQVPLLAAHSITNAPLARDICSSKPVKSVFTKIAEFFLDVPLENCAPTGSLLKQLKSTDMLFIHSKKDIVISDADFSMILDEVQEIQNKCTLFTYNPHAMNHIKQKELYKFIGEQFIEHSFNDFARLLSSL